MRKFARKGFTLVELLVVMGIIAVLMSILLPSLSRARETANKVKCANNLRSIGQGLLIYINENRGTIPSAYSYRDLGAVTFDSNGNAVQSGLSAAKPEKSYGYVHWSSYLNGTVPADAFQCPSTKNGGLPQTFPDPASMDAGQGLDGSPAAVALASVTDPTLKQRLATATYVAGKQYYVDDQAPRIAYTVNEALFARPKWATLDGNGANWDGVHHVARHVNVSEVKNAAGTIAITEFPGNWRIVSGATTSGGGSDNVVKSHRPVQPFRLNDSTTVDGDEKGGATGCGLTNYAAAATGTKFDIRRTNAGDLWNIATAEGTYSADLETDADGNYAQTTRFSRLDWVGRNHLGQGKSARENVTNFLYLDGHIETKSILDTVPAHLNDAGPWEWGAKCYTISDAHVVTPGDATTPEK